MASSRTSPTGDGRQSPTSQMILLQLRQQLPTCADRYGVRSLGLFGSYVRGEQRPDSDIDVLVEFERVPSLIEFLTLERELSEALGVRVDLVMKDSLKPVIGQHILREVVPV